MGKDVSMAEIDKRVHTLNNVFERLESILDVLQGRRDETNREAIEVLETLIENASTFSYQEALVRLDTDGLKEYYKTVTEFVLVLAKQVGVPESMLMEGLRDSQPDLRTEGIESTTDFQWPLENNTITSKFGKRDDAKPFKHDGIDLSAAVGTPVYAVSSGTVTLADLEYKGSDSESSYLIIKGTNGYEQRYLHMDSFSVKVGDNVNKGDVIGYAGARKTKDAHLHFELRKNGTAVDPELHLPKKGD